MEETHNKNMDRKKPFNKLIATIAIAAIILGVIYKAFVKPSFNINDIIKTAFVSGDFNSGPDGNPIGGESLYICVVFDNSSEYHAMDQSGADKGSTTIGYCRSEGKWELKDGKIILGKLAVNPNCPTDRDISGTYTVDYDANGNMELTSDNYVFHKN